MADHEIHYLKEPVGDDDWVQGPTGAPVTLVEYADFQCNDCQNSHPVLARVLASFKDEVRFVFRHFPMVSKHPQAEQAALAAEAAGRQGKFWEMERLLIEARGALSPEDLDHYAQELGLDLVQFHRDLTDDSLRAKIRRGKLAGLRSGVNGTPTLFINEVRYEGERTPVDETELRKAIEQALQPRP